MVGEGAPFLIDQPRRRRSARSKADSHGLARLLAGYLRDGPEAVVAVEEEYGIGLRRVEAGQLEAAVAELQPALVEGEAAVGDRAADDDPLARWLAVRLDHLAAHGHSAPQRHLDIVRCGARHGVEGGQRVRVVAPRAWPAAVQLSHCRFHLDEVTGRAFEQEVPGTGRHRDLE